MLRPTGAMVAIVTPFKDGAVDETALRGLIERQLEGGSSGIIPCGTTGESATVSDAERNRVIAITVDQVNGRALVIAGTGTNNTAASVANTRVALELGADACLAVCPPYNKPSQDGLFAHFTAIADVGLPVVLYNVPGRTVVSLTAETVARLSRHEHIVAIKEATADLRLATAMFEACGDRITFLSGDDFTTFPFVTAGGHGCISVVANLDPQLITDLVAAADSGDLDRGRALHRKVCRLGALCFSDSNPAPTKHMLALLGLCTDELRLPLIPVSNALGARIRAGLVEEGYLSS